MKMKRKLFFVLIVCLFGSFASSAFAASTIKRAGENPFYRPPLTSEADLKALVKNRNTQLRTGFAKAGYPNLYRDFAEQFPTAIVDPIKVSPGETFKWMLFRKKGTGPVIAAKDVTWGGAGALDAYRFYINSQGERYEFAVLNACGNFALRNSTRIPAPMRAAPEKAVVVPPPAPMPAAPEKAMVMPPPAPMPATPEKAADAPPSAQTPAAPEKAAVVPPPAPMPAIPKKAADAPPSAPTPAAPEKAAAGSMASLAAAKFPWGLVVDTGFSYQFDPASYLFARIGYEFPLFDKLGLLAMVGGSFRVYGKDGGNAFIADAILDYHWWNRLSFGLGAGFWSGNGGQMDLIANLGFLVYEKPNSFNSTLFLEARSKISEMSNMHDQARFSLGIRFRF
jgi:hypothetical protein